MRATSLSKFPRLAPIVLAALAVVVALGVGGTYAYLSTTTKSVSNTLGTGSVGLMVSEGSGGQSLTVTGDGTATATLGTNTKQVTLTNTGTVAEYIRVSFVPEVEQEFYDESTKTTQMANVFMDENWPTSFSGTELTLGLVTLHFADGWASSWTYKNGAFISTNPVDAKASIGPLLTGVTWATDASTGAEVAHDDYTMRVNVIAEAVQTAAKSDAFGS